MKNFQRLEVAELAEIQQEVAENEHLWTLNTSRQKSARGQRDTQTIFIRSAKKPYPEGAQSKGVRETAMVRWTWSRSAGRGTTTAAPHHSGAATRVS